MISPLSSRRLIIAAATIQLLAAFAFLVVNESVDVGKYVLFRPVTIAQHEGGDPTKEAIKCMERLSIEFYYPSLIFGIISIFISVGVIYVAIRFRESK